MFLSLPSHSGNELSAKDVLHQNNPTNKISIAFFMIPKSYTLINVESVEVR
jgi:hypothetical protein